MEKNKANEIYCELKKIFPEAKCELNYNNIFELLIAVVLSAQTTDISVNNVTKELFKKFPNATLLAKGDINEVKTIIKSIGLTNNKAKNIIALSKILTEEYNGVVPNNFEELIKLPGVGRKTANVVLSEGFNIPRIAVDTHVYRVSKRLGLSTSDDVLKVEMDLMNLFEKKYWHNVHHTLLFFGRYLCKAIKPSCSKCQLKSYCVFTNKT